LTDYFIDSLEGSDSNDGLSPSSPKRTIPWVFPVSVPSNSLISLRGGGTYDSIAAIYIGAKTDVRISTHGTGKALLRNTAVSFAPVLHILNSSNVEVSNLEIDGLGIGHFGILTQISNDNTYYNVRIHHCDIYNCSQPNPLGIADENTNAGVHMATLYKPVLGYSVTDCEVHDCYASGIHNVGSLDGAYFARNKLYRNCSQQGAHNFSGHPLRLVVTSGWSSIGGNLYSRAFNNNDVFVVNCGYPSGTYLKKNIVNPSNPSPNEFGWAGGVLYINFAQNPNSISTGIVYTEFKNFVIENNESYEAVNWLPYPYDEGHGIALDDWAGPGIIRYNYIHDNDGLGISCNKGFGNLIYGNIIVDNKLGGVTAWHDTKVYNNTFIRNGQANTSESRQVWLVKAAGLSTENVSALSNNIFYCNNNQAYIVSSINQTCEFNLFYNHFLANSWGGLQTSNVIVADPQLDALFRPQVYNPSYARWWVNERPCDYYGEPLPDVGIDVGAVSTFLNEFHPMNL
jgi:hypothetical protein